MYHWYSTRKAKNQRSIQSVLLTVLLIVGIICWISINNVYAVEDDPSDNGETADTVSSNAAQDQKAENLAEQAALQDPAVAQSYAEAGKTGNVDEANALYEEKVEEYNAQIDDMRASGMGWGDIAHELGVHPSVLGLGHSKKDQSQKGFFSKLSHIGSEIKAAISKGFKGGRTDKGGKTGSSSKNMGYGSTNNKGQGYAKGHQSDVNGGRGSGKEGAHGGEHDGGRGGGNGNGSGNGGGNGNGGGGGNGGGKK